MATDGVTSHLCFGYSGFWYEGISISSCNADKVIFLGLRTNPIGQARQLVASRISYKDIFA